MKTSSIHLLFGVGLLSVGLGNAANAVPSAPREVCRVYPDAPACQGRVVSCAFCHTAPPALNPYGIDVFTGLAQMGYSGGEATLVDRLEGALYAVEALDSDGNEEGLGLRNLEEILLGTRPGEADSFFERTLDAENEYDPAFAYRRAHVAFCGVPPTYDDMMDFPAGMEAGKEAVIDATRRCLDSDYWKNEALHRLADARIRPEHSVSYDRGNRFSLADYRFDYRLFSHALSEGRDARLLLSADYHLDEEGNVVEEPFTRQGVGGNLGQPLRQDKRAGMITTTWFLVIHTMFADMPRTSAAQFYRAYLGEDLSLSEGMRPVFGEPVDVDKAGVTERTCAVCHSTLDPATYAFSYYHGIAGRNSGTFDRGRGERVRGGNGGGTQSAFLDQLTDDDPLLKPADHGLSGIGELAANSEGFARTMVFALAEYAMGRKATPEDTLELLPLKERFRNDLNYNANALLEELVLTDAFGRP